MIIAMPTKMTLEEQLRPAMLAAALIIAGVLLIPVGYPVHVANGTISPDIVRPGDKGVVSWSQNWTHLCPVMVVREFIGADGFKSTSAPYELQPPAEKGVSPYLGAIVIPNLPAGDAHYHAIIKPQCWVDKLIYQREYRTPDIRVTMLPPALPGPR